MTLSDKDALAVRRQQRGVPRGYTVLHTDVVVGDVGWRWSRWRAERFCERMNNLRRMNGVLDSFRYSVERVGLGRWRVVAMQNQLRPVDG